jgi:hypothetical protein
MNDNGTNWFTYHYYDGNDNGNAKLGLNRLYWTPDNWPALTNDWSAFYTFNTDAREHLGLYNGALQDGATITNEPARGNVLYLDGVDILDGTPLLDIKPYSAKFDRIETFRNGWQDEVDEETARRRGRRAYRGGAA